MGAAVSRSMADLLYDPQTSGGLLICVDAADGEKLVEKLVAEGVEWTAEIGRVLPGPEEKIIVS